MKFFHFFRSQDNGWENKLKELEDKLEGVRTLESKLGILPKLEGKLDALQKLEERLAGLKALEGKLDALQKFEERLEGLKALEGKFEVLQKLEERLEGLMALEGKFEVLQKFEKRLEGKFEALQAKAENLESVLSTKATSQQMDSMIGALRDAALGDNFSRMKEEIQEIKLRLGECLNAVALIPRQKEQLSALEDETATVVSTLAEVSSKIVNILIDMDGASKNMASAIQDGQKQAGSQIGAWVNEIAQGLGKLEDRVSHLSQDVAAAAAETHAHGSEQTAGIEQLSGRLAALEREQSAFPPSSAKEILEKLWAPGIEQISQNLEILQKAQREIYQPALQTIDAQLSSLHGDLDEKIGKEVNRMGRTLFKLTGPLETVSDKFQQGLAVFERERSQYEKEKQRLTEQGGEQLRQRELQMARDLFPMMDALDAAIETGERLLDSPQPKPLFGFLSRHDGGALREAIKSWLGGIQMMHKRALDLLRSLGVETIESVSQVFNPHFHSAIGAENGPDNVVMKEVTRGYKTKEYVLRYAEVIVGKASAGGELPLNTL